MAKHEMQEGSPDYWRALHDRLVREGRLPGPEMGPAIPPAPVPPVDPFGELDVLEAAGYLEAMKEAARLVDEQTYPEWAAELEDLRAEARAIFERKFLEVN